MVERVTLTDEQKKLIAKTKPLIQKLNTEVHTDNEIRLPFFITVLIRILVRIFLLILVLLF